MRRKSIALDMVNGPLWKNIFLFSLPLMLSSLLQILLNAADTIVVGKFSGQEALAAVGATGSIVFLLTALFNGVAVGANVIVARYLGTRDFQKTQKAVHTSLMIAILGGVVLSLVGVFFSEHFLRWMGTPLDFIHLSVRYMQIYFLGTIPSLIYNFGSAVLRSKGDTRRPLYFLAIAGILNIILNLYTVIYLRMGVAGVAISTVVSQILSAYLIILTLLQENDATRFHSKKTSLR